MSKPIEIAVVGHTNAGKTSLLRTLTRHSDFGEVSEQPGTTRHVEAIDLKIDGVSAVRFFDTPGLEDSTTLLDYLRALENCVTPPDRIRALLKGPEARASFEQEAKVLRKMLEVDAAVYVIDTREAVLPKFRAEIEILTWCAKPVMPVLNFVRHHDSRKDEWLDALSAYNLHAYVQFDAVAPFIGSERELYQSMAIMLRARRDQLMQVIEDLEFQFQERRSAGCQVIAELLVDMTALRREISREDLEIADKKKALIRDVRSTVLKRARQGIDDLLQVYGFRKEDADEAVLPWLDGRWEADLFNPETLRDASKKLGTGAAVGAAIGFAADLALAGMSLGAASALGAAIGGIASQGWGQFGRKLANKVFGVEELTLENEVLLVMAEHMLNLLWTLEQRGHAAMGKVSSRQQTPHAANEELKRLIEAVQPARSHPDWESTNRRKYFEYAQRNRFVLGLTEKIKRVALLKTGERLAQIRASTS
jgi:GTPase Era involved in 16S rRNA processing